MLKYSLPCTFLFLFLLFISPRHCTYNTSALDEDDSIDDCCCTKNDLFQANQALNPLLNRLVKQRFFSYFKVDLFSDCPFWVSESLCTLEGEGGCGICECDDNDPVIRHWKNAKTDQVAVLKENSNWIQWEDSEKHMWFLPADEKDMSFVNLQDYTEANTEYDGTLIWKQIYEENCFLHPQEEMCLEEKIFYKLISGLHTSINAHICINNQLVHGAYTDNPGRLGEKILPYPDRIENLHFAFLFLSRAITKIKPELLEYSYETGNPYEDSITQQLMEQLLENDLLCSPIFDETILFQEQDNMSGTTGKSKLILRDQFKEAFRNISSIMNCVSCEKCRVYGKLQTLGLGTALKIVLEPDLEHVISKLQRNEIIALIYTFRQLSNSIDYINKFQSHSPTETPLWGYIDSFLFLMICILVLIFTSFTHFSKPKVD